MSSSAHAVGLRNPQNLYSVVIALVVMLISPTLGAGERVENGLRIRTSRVTGLASFVTPADGKTIPVARARGAAKTMPTDFLVQYGHHFGVRDVKTQLVQARTSRDPYGFTHTKFDQVHKGVEVFGGVLIVHQDANDKYVAANGHFFPLAAHFESKPGVTAEAAQKSARARVNRGQPVVEDSRLVIVDPGWYGDFAVGPQLAYHIILSDMTAGVREAFFINAQTGKVLDQWNLLHTAKNRTVFDDFLNTTVRTEGGPATGDFEADAAYDWSGDTYDYLFRGLGRDSLNGSGNTLSTTVHLQSNSCPNAFGGTGGTLFCDGVVTDDIVAHEFGHGLTGFTANLIYQNQSGQLNESFSDVLGEIVDLLNGDAAFAGPPGGTPWPSHATGSGTDTPNTMRTGCELPILMTVNSPGVIAGDYGAQPASFGPSLTPSGITGNLVLAIPIRGCDIDLPFANGAAMSGNIVLIDRAECFFTEKVRNAQDQGAIAVIIANNVAGGPAPMGGSDFTVLIPSVGITLDDGDILKAAAATDTVNITLRSNSGGSVRWLVGEDSAGFGGAIRDMWQPSCMGDPDTANHPLQICNPDDGGGVHSGSGIPNHAFAMLTDGKSFNGQDVNAIGLFKAGAVWLHALINHLTVTSDFEDAYAAINLSASQLIGQTISDPRDGTPFGVFSAADAAEVDKALRAVEMNTPGLCGTSELLDTTPPQKCSGRTILFFDDFESGINGWSVSNTSPPTDYDWVQQSGGLPFGRTGTVWVGEDRDIGNCGNRDESAVHFLFSPQIVLPAALSSPTLAFTHYVDTEAFYDGGNLKINVNGGGWQLVGRAAFTYNPYNGALSTSENTNPMAGEVAFTGSPLSGGGWGTSLVDFSEFVSPNDTVQFRFDFGKDGCFGINGWFVDDVEVYNCSSGDCNDNSIEDVIDISGGFSLDCDANSTPDECQIDENSTAPNGPFFCTVGCDPDCNETGIPDSCETDCQPNGIPDDCDIASGSSFDINTNDIPDECECVVSAQPQLAQVQDAGGSLVSLRTMRMIGIKTASAGAGRIQGIRIKAVGLAPPFDVWNGQSMWVGPPVEYSEFPGRGVDTPGAVGTETTFLSSELQCDPFLTDWSVMGDAIIWARGEFVVPSDIVAGGGGLSSESRYAVQFVDALCTLTNEPSFSTPTEIVSAGWGDIGALASGEARAVNDTVGVEDTLFILQKFTGTGGVSGGLPIKARTDMLGVTTGPAPELDLKITVAETLHVLASFSGSNYPFTPVSDAVCPVSTAVAGVQSTKAVPQEDVLGVTER